MTTTPLDVDVVPAHTQALAELTSIADRVRYACQSGPGPRTDEVRQWLAAYGYETKRPYVSTLVTGYRVSRGMDDTGDLPQLTGEVIADFDRARPADAEPVKPADTERLRELGEIVRAADNPALTPNGLAEMDELARSAGIDWKPEALRDFAIELKDPAVVTLPDDADPVGAVVVTPEPPVVTDLNSASPEGSKSASAEIRIHEPAPVPPTPAEPVTTDTEPVVTVAAAPVGKADKKRHGVRAFTVATLVLSSLATVTGVVVALHTAPSTVLDWSPGVQLTAGIAALVALIGFVWSATSTAAALASGRTARDVALDVASWTVALFAGFLAAAGQIAFARWAHILDWKAYLVPGILEPSVVVLLLLANRRVQKAVAGLPTKPIGKLLALAALLGGFAIYTNVVHAPDGSGLVFGAATAIGLMLWWVKLQDGAGAELIQEAPQSKRISRRTSGYRLMRWVILPAQTTRAWLISLDHSVDDAEIGLDLARRWRRDYEDFRALKNGPIVARRHASRQVERHAAEIAAKRAALATATQ